MLLGDLHNFVNVARVAKEMHQNNGAGAISDVRLDRFGGHVQRLGIYIGEDGHSVLHENWHNAAGIGDRCGDDFVAGVRITTPTAVWMAAVPLVDACACCVP